jgi:hypothetical protein
MASGHIGIFRNREVHKRRLRGVPRILGERDTPEPSITQTISNPGHPITILIWPSSAAVSTLRSLYIHGAARPGFADARAKNRRYNGRVAARGSTSSHFSRVLT